MNPPEPFSSLPGMKYQAGTSGGEWADRSPPAAGGTASGPGPTIPRPKGAAAGSCVEAAGAWATASPSCASFMAWTIARLARGLACAWNPPRVQDSSGPTAPATSGPRLFVPPLDAWRTAARRFLSGLPLAVEYGRGARLDPKDRGDSPGLRCGTTATSSSLGRNGACPRRRVPRPGRPKRV